MQVKMSVMGRKVMERNRVMSLSGRTRLLRPWTETGGDEYVRFDGEMTIVVTVEMYVHNESWYWEVHQTRCHRQYHRRTTTLEKAMAFADQKLLELGYKLMTQRDSILL